MTVPTLEGESIKDAKDKDTKSDTSKRLLQL
jgi:hypothetical protein